MKRFILGGLVLIVFCGSAHAGECKLRITRTACAGKEAESYKKCDGKQSCTVTVAAGDEAACAKEALKACENTPDRQKVTKSKTITATLDGKSVEGGKNFCAPDRPDFNKC